MAVAPASARPASCYTTDDGFYPCEFRSAGRDGSFRISAPGRPGYVLQVISFGRAAAFLRLGGPSVALPGLYRRDADGSGCWTGDTTGTRICAK